MTPLNKLTKQNNNLYQLYRSSENVSVTEWRLIPDATITNTHAIITPKTAYLENLQ